MKIKALGYRSKINLSCSRALPKDSQNPLQKRRIYFDVCGVFLCVASTNLSDNSNYYLPCILLVAGEPDINRPQLRHNWTNQAGVQLSFIWIWYIWICPSVCSSGLEKILQPAARGGAASALKWPLRRAQRENMTKLLLKSTILKVLRKWQRLAAVKLFPGLL